CLQVGRRLARGAGLGRRHADRAAHAGSPGWTEEEVEVLRNALLKFGVGNWAKIIESQCLAGKTVAQMNLQTQRMLGQQSTAGRRAQALLARAHRPMRLLGWQSLPGCTSTC